MTSYHQPTVGCTVPSVISDFAFQALFSTSVTNLLLASCTITEAGCVAGCVYTVSCAGIPKAVISALVNVKACVCEVVVTLLVVALVIVLGVPSVIVKFPFVAVQAVIPFPDVKV